MAYLNYVSQDLSSVTVEYDGMPADADIAFVSVTSGTIKVSPSAALAKGGKGTAKIPFADDLAAGAYCLQAQTKEAKPAFIAQTVVFYVHKLTARQSIPLWKKIKPAKKGK